MTPAKRTGGGSAARVVPLEGSERRVLPGARDVGAASKDDRVEVTVYVRRDPRAPNLPDPDEFGAEWTLRGRHIGNDDFEAAYRASDADLEAVRTFADRVGLETGEVNPIARSVRLSGTVAQMQSAFGVELRRYEYPGGTYRGRTGPVHIPAELDGIVEAVLGLDNRRLGKPYVRESAHATIPLEAAQGGGLPPNTYLPPQLGQIYNFPTTLDGSGECVAILAFNDVNHGGYELLSLRTYYERVLGQRTPNIVDVVVHGQGNDPGSDSPQAGASGDSSGEIMLDMCVVGALVPGATLAMYFTEFTEQGWVDAINAAVTDTTNNPSVVSCSYGNPEDDPRSAWTTMAIRKTNEAFQAAAARGVTICCASGDDGSRDQGGGPRAHADFPASSPYVLGCGGTRLVVSPTHSVSETVWNDGPGSATGGGVSRLFSLPLWQQHAGVPPSANPDHRRGRGVPDVAANADPQTGDVIISLDGRSLVVVGGTSAAAPLWSALIARLNQGLSSRVGFLNPVLYTSFSHGVLRDIVWGNNGAYRAGPGWDACTGLGSPNGVALLAALRSTAAATRPDQTVTTPFAAAYADLVARLVAAWVSVDDADRVQDAYKSYVQAWQQATTPDPYESEWDRGNRLAILAAQADEAVRTWQYASHSSDGSVDERARRLQEALSEYLQTIGAAWGELDAAVLDPSTLTTVFESVAAAMGSATAWNLQSSAVYG